MFCACGHYDSISVLNRMFFAINGHFSLAVFESEELVNIAFIMGVYLGGLVQALVKDLLLPVIGLAIPGLGNLATWKIPIPGTTLDSSGNPPAGYTGQLFGLGDFLVALITFIIVALVVFLVVKVAKRWGME